MGKYIRDLSYSQVLEIIAKQTLTDVGGIQDFLFNEALEEIRHSDQLIMISPEDIVEGKKEYYYFLKCAEDSLLIDVSAKVAEVTLSLMDKKFLVFDCRDEKFL